MATQCGLPGGGDSQLRGKGEQFPPFLPQDPHMLAPPSLPPSLQYLGSVIVVRVRGKQSTEEACLRLRVRASFLHSPIPPFPIPSFHPQTSTEHMQKLPDVLLSFSWKCVKFIDGKTKVGCHGYL